MMQQCRKVVWAEGILLGQQHFQQWDRYLQAQRELALYHTQPLSWGIGLLSLDENYLAQGVVRVTRCLALLQDRRWVELAADDKELTAAIPTDKKKTLGVYLQVPRSDQVDAIQGYPTSYGLPEWQGIYDDIPDQFDKGRVREVLLAKQNIRLAFDEEAAGDISALKVAELEFNPEQASFRLNRQYVPPVLSMGASDNLMSLLAKFIASLTQQISVVRTRKEKHQHLPNQFGYGDFIYFNLQKTLATHLAKLIALQKHPQMPPYTFYEACLGLVGELWGYIDNPLSGASLPAYDHRNLGGLFSQLFLCYEQLVTQALPANTMDICLHRMSDTEYQTSPLLLEDLKSKQYCLAVYHESMTPELIEKIRAQIKISSPSQLAAIVQTFTQGIELTHMISPSQDFLVKQHCHYFLLNKHAMSWSAILEERMMGLFVSQELASLSLEFIQY